MCGSCLLQRWQIVSIEISDLTFQQVESNTQFSLNTNENICFEINPSSTCDVDTEMGDLSYRQVEKYVSILPYDTDDEEITGDITYMRETKYVHDYVYEDVQPITCDFMSDNIKGTTMYIVPLHASEKMSNCKGTRPRGMAKLVKVIRSRKGRDYYKTVEEAIVVQTSDAKTLQAFGLTDWNSSKKEGVMIHYLCG